MSLTPANLDERGAARLNLIQKVQCASEATQAAAQAAHTASDQPTGPGQLQSFKR